MRGRIAQFIAACHDFYRAVESLFESQELSYRLMNDLHQRMNTLTDRLNRQIVGLENTSQDIIVWATEELKMSLNDIEGKPGSHSFYHEEATPDDVMKLLRFLVKFEKGPIAYVNTIRNAYVRLFIRTREASEYSGPLALYRDEIASLLSGTNNLNFPVDQLYFEE